jgi:hypothetical protein
MMGYDQVKLEWIELSLKSEDSPVADALRAARPIDEEYYLMIVFFMLIGLIKAYQSGNLSAYFPHVIILGAALMILLVETQPRYRYAAEPMFALAAAFGVSWAAGLARDSLGRLI